MVELALQRGGLDNVTVVVIRLLAEVVRTTEPTRSPADSPERSGHES
jgi:protein phosphatase